MAQDESSRGSTVSDGAAGSMSVAERVQRSASDAAENLKAHASDAAEQQKNVGAEKIGEVADAMKAAASDLEGTLPSAAEYVTDVAGRLGSVASALRERRVDDMIANTAEFARQRPTVFFAGAVAAGFALARFAKSSASREVKGHGE